MKKHLFISLILCAFSSAFSQVYSPSEMEEIIYGVAYYPEYMPEERLEKDIALMKESGINTVRMCESTWAYMEPSNGNFNLSWIKPTLDAMHKNNIKVIIGTPTYAIPSWMARQHPEVMAVTKNGQNQYGHRQRMDITNKDYRFYANRMIRKLMEIVADHPSVIGYQVDNETKHYGTAGENVQAAFRAYLKDKFKTTEALNQAFGLQYWSNSVAEWDDLPSTVATINASYGSEFSKFQRMLVTEFLAWQAGIIREYKKENQFITQNFDLSWRNGSYGVQTDVDHFEASKSMDVAGVDIYHDNQDKLDGVSIALGGALAWSMKRTNYLVMETQGQSILGSKDQQLAYPGQLRLQAYSHLASGANMIAYWPWHSIHNSWETYWKGILSHDMEPNPTFYEAKQITDEFKKIGKELVNLKKNNDVAIYVSNESLSTMNDWFGISYELGYNDVVRNMFKSLYEMNVECDFVDNTSTNLQQYKALFIPPLYVASDEELIKLNEYAKKGGHIVYAFRSGFSNENVQVRRSRMPGILRESCGFSYQQFTSIKKLGLQKNSFDVDEENNYVTDWAELLVPESCEVLASYDHPYWGKYAAITRNNYGKGTVTYLGTWPSYEILSSITKETIEKAGLMSPDQEQSFPIVIKHGMNKDNDKIHYYFNYSGEAKTVKYPYKKGKRLLKDQRIKTSENIDLSPWGVAIVKEE